jgi:hypothetical protein
MKYNWYTQLIVDALLCFAIFSPFPFSYSLSPPYLPFPLCIVLYSDQKFILQIERVKQKWGCWAKEELKRTYITEKTVGIVTKLLLISSWVTFCSYLASVTHWFSSCHTGCAFNYMGKREGFCDLYPFPLQPVWLSSVLWDLCYSSLCLINLQNYCAKFL